MEENVDKNPEPPWPSLSLAYQFVAPSYQWAMNRLEAVERRMQNLVTFSVSFTVAVPVVAKLIDQEVNYRSNWFFSALSVALVIVIAGTLTVNLGSLTIISPETLDKEPWRSYDEEGFKRHAVLWAGQHLEGNRSLVNRKGVIAVVLSLLFALETSFMLLWLFGS